MSTVANILMIIACSIWSIFGVWVVFSTIIDERRIKRDFRESNREFNKQMVSVSVLHDDIDMIIASLSSGQTSASYDRGAYRVNGQAFDKYLSVNIIIGNESSVTTN